MKPHGGSEFQTGESSNYYQPIFSQQVEKEAYIPHIPADVSPSAIQALIRLTNVNNSRQIGLNGPPNAAGSTEKNKHLAEQNHYQEGYPRDAHVSAFLLWERYPELTSATVLAYLPYTGTIDNLSNPEWIDEQEVGKTPHQVRDPNHPRSIRQYELRKRGYPYYGAIDTTQKNILGISRVSLSDPPHSLSFLDEQYTDIHGQVRTVANGFDANVGWVIKRPSLNPEGLIESIQINPRHHANQSWADSPDSFHHADGSLARHHPEKDWGVASVEVNAETYDAMLAAIPMYEAILPSAEDSEREFITSRIETLKAMAANLKKVIHEQFWVDDPDHYGGYFARGTDRDEDGNLHPLKIRSSDMGHLLLSEVLDDGDPKIVSIIENLFSPEMLAENGIRTLSSDSVRYHKDAYHNGSVWPWDTYMIALGLEKRGYPALVEEIENRIIDFHNETNTLAEYGSGGSDGEDRINMNHQVTIFDPDQNEEPIDQYSVYNVIQPPQEIQAWTVAAVAAIKFKRTQRMREGNQPRQADDPDKRALELTILERISKSQDTGLDYN